MAISHWLYQALSDRPGDNCTLGSSRLDGMQCDVQARSRRSVAGKDIMLDPRAGIRKAGAMPPLMALLTEVVEVCDAAAATCLHGGLLQMQEGFPHHERVLRDTFSRKLLTGLSDRNQGGIKLVGGLR